jgi:hypothetical protein
MSEAQPLFLDHEKIMKWGEGLLVTIVKKHIPLIKRTIVVFFAT